MVNFGYFTVSSRAEPLFRRSEGSPAPLAPRASQNAPLPTKRARVARAFFDLAERPPEWVPRPCDFCKGGTMLPRALGLAFTLDPSSNLARGSSPYRSTISTNLDLCVRGTHPCTERKDGHPLSL